MPSTLPRFPKLEIRQPLAAADISRVDALGALIILLPESALQKRWPEFVHGDLLKKRLPAGKKTLTPTRFDLPSGTVAVLASYRPGLDAFELLTLARKCVAKLQEAAAQDIGVLTPGAPGEERGQLLDAVVSAAAAASFRGPDYKKHSVEKPVLRSVTLFDGRQPLDFNRRLAEAEANHLARWLTLQPPNHLTPGEYRSHAQFLAKREGWKAEYLDERRLKALGAGAFLAVAQGSETRDAGIMHLSYRPSKMSRKARGLALIGKGICYDTGGVNLKTAKSMFGMHGDMQGSAVALATMLALSRMKVPFQVDAWLALARNQIGPKAYTQNDVVRASNGLSIEVVHTDAEGRMVLADTLALASRSNPALMLDYATLTGACTVALGNRYSGAFCNRRELDAPVIAAGHASGERVWPFPVDADYDEELESEIADVKQCIIESQADHILAARFLGRFVPSTIRWIHIDLSAAEHKGGLAHVPTEVTGFGVRFTLNLLYEQGLAPR